MTVAAQKQIVLKALALPKKARARLAGKLLKSLEEPETKISRKEWNQAWKTELDKRLEELRSGKVKGIPLEEARKVGLRSWAGLELLHLHPLTVGEINEALLYYRAAEADGVADDYMTDQCLL